MGGLLIIIFLFILDNINYGFIDTQKRTNTSYTLRDNEFLIKL